jgi:hypothetical protein
VYDCCIKCYSIFRMGAKDLDVCACGQSRWKLEKWLLGKEANAILCVQVSASLSLVAMTSRQ